MLVCTGHGVFSYDGRRFLNLGSEHGLPDGGIVYGIALTSAGRIAIQFSTEIFVSDRPTDTAHPATSLSFMAVDHPGIDLYEQRQHRLVPWHDGFLFLAGSETVGITVPATGPARFEALGYTPKEQALLHGAAGIFSANGNPWETFDDGRVCSAEPGTVRCYGTKDGLGAGPWLDVAADPDGWILARAETSGATFDPNTPRWSAVPLPDQGGRYKGYLNGLGLFTTPDGRVATQTAQGLAIRGPEGWREMTVADGAPDGTIVDAMTDGTGELGVHMLGRGLLRWVGYGHWTTVENSDGLSAGFPWQTARSADGHLWVTTDGGVNELVPRNESVHLLRTYPFGSYALAATPAGEIWAGYENKGVRVIDPQTGSMSPITVPGTLTIVPGPDHMVWLGTSKGLYRVDDGRGPPFQPVLLRSTEKPVQSIARDGGGGVYYLCGGWLHHWHQDGSDATVTGPGWKRSDESMGLAIARDGSLWVSGPRGLRHLILADDRIRTNQAIAVDDVRSTTIPAVMIDHRGWVWAGTSLGISVFDGARWVSADADQGLLSDDINEDGIREDLDGSVWIATTSGLAHLKDPASLFVVRPLTVMVTGARLGTKAVGAATTPYTQDPLSIDLGTPNYGVERSVLFRHQLSGVDGGWVTSSSGTVSYPFVPPGRHLFTVIGYDPLSHRTSAPVTLVIKIAYPWWQRWWSEAFWVALALAAVYAVLRIRYRAMYARQAELKRHVASATAQLRHVATHDKLTGLLNRAEVETRLAGALARGGGSNLVVALLDVDHFKRINDEHGHLAGDEVLRALGHMVSRSLRDGEYAGRYGGEEILLALADADGSAAERVLKLHLAIRQDIFLSPGGPISITCSIGLAWVSSGDTWESLIGRADAALYQAKRSGRDQVIESQFRPSPVRLARD